MSHEVASCLAFGALSLLMKYPFRRSIIGQKKHQSIKNYIYFMNCAKSACNKC